MITLAEAIKIAEKYIGVKVYQYAESDDSYVFSVAKPGEILYGPRPYIVSKKNGAIRIDLSGVFAPWPYGKWLPIEGRNNE
ncbi:hypothetical protein [uncultured Acidaminococcus sp.]|jgi:hypothetical protein|uniref:hypothetical protein n=1 Tax=uncultured Acidaminococcus sp. TaxID=352152 RepID=UPI0025CBAEF9|nr:hypothetical protein [uncultured Acidaminococcus sp.]